MATNAAYRYMEPFGLLLKVDRHRTDRHHMKLRLRRSPSASPVPLTRRALVDLLMVTAFVWIAVLAIVQLDLPAGLAEWNAAHQDWAIDEFTLVSLVVAVSLGIFSWRRWQESASTLARHQETLDQLHTTESLIAARDDLIRSVSHELRTPLTAVLGYAELLGSTGLDAPERTEIVGTIIREGRDLSNIVEDLITRARSEAETLEVAMVRVSMAGQAAQVLESRSPAELDQIVRQLDPKAFATGDPARVRQILRNLLSNAFKYGEGSVEITAIADDDTVGLSISNQGQEIPEPDHEKIFDPYHRVSGEGPKPGGLGLGLAISRQLARMMGGDLSYRYESGRSFFDLRLTRFVKIPDESEAPAWLDEAPEMPPIQIEQIPDKPETPAPVEETPETPPIHQETQDLPETPIHVADAPSPPDVSARVEDTTDPPQPQIRIQEIPDVPIQTEDIPDPPQPPTLVEQTPEMAKESVQIEEITAVPETPAPMEETPETPPIQIEQIPDKPETPTWVEEIPDVPAAPTWVEEIRDTSEAPAWMEEIPNESQAPILIEEIPDAPEAPVRVGEGPFDFLGLEGQDQRL